MNASLDPPAPGRTRFLPGRARPVHGLASVLAAVLAFGPTVALSSPLATLPTIYVTYTTDCTFTMSADGGIEISSPTAPGVVIPPGSYQVVVSQGYALSPGAPRCPPSTYELTGPGVSLSFVVGEGSPYEQAVASFAPSSTFVAVVEDAPLAQLVFTTAATGSSSSLLSPTQAPAAGTAQTQPGLVGSQISSGRGTLRATVGRSGKATLSAHGRSVVSLAAGVYEIVVADESADAGFTLAKLHQRAVELSGASFVGKRTAKVDLTAGSWSFYATPSGARRFLVVA